MLRSCEGHTPKLHPTAFVSEAAYVVGKVDIGEGSSVWPGTVIRGDQARVTLGKNVNFQDNCTIHADSDATYGDNVTLGHGVICQAKSVGNNVLIGNGAIVNNEAEIGEHSIVASGSVVLDGKKLPPRSFIVGIPAEVKGHTTDRHLKMIEGTAANYRENGARFQKAGLGSRPPE